MADFYQNGLISTLHNLSTRDLNSLEDELRAFTKERPIGLVLPSLFSELEAPALDHIVKTLADADYVGEIVIGLDRADEDQFRYAKKYFSRLPQHHRILWNEGPRLQALNEMLVKKGLAPRELGKGRNVWYCFGYILASARSQAIGLHDCDIVTYDRSLLARLLYPVANPNFSYKFCKGYYSRVSQNRLKGRVCRLLVTPLINSLKMVLGHHPYLDYLGSFRYPLAGEFSMQADVLRDIRIPSDWGLEIGTLSEVYRHYATRHLCQVDIAGIYDHKHQKLSVDDATRGLNKMSTDITKAIIRKLATQGQIFSQGTFRTIKASYYRTALDFVETYYNDAMINGLDFDRHEEEEAVELFLGSVVRAGEQFLSNPLEAPFIPNWNRIISAFPDFLEQLKEAVELDNAEA